MFSPTEYRRIVLEGTWMSAASIAACLWGAARYGPGPRATTIAFLTLVGSQLLHVLSVRSENHSLFDPERLPQNRYVPLALGGGVATTLLAQLVPGLRRLLGSAPIGRADWLVVSAGAVAPLLVCELAKIRRRMQDEPEDDAECGA